MEEQLITNFLESEAKVSGCSQAMMASGIYSGNSQRVPKQRTSLHLAYFGLGEMMGVLLKSRYDLDSKDSNGQTPLSWAAAKGNEAVVKLLLEKGADLESKDKKYGRTPLSWAAESGHKAVEGTKLESKSKHGQTSLSWAARKGYKAVVKLLEKGADLESKDNYGQTPLSYAAERGDEAVVKLLLEKGAELESKDIEYSGLQRRSTKMHTAKSTADAQASANLLDLVHTYPVSRDEGDSYE
jgi:hypothetical protein